MCASFISPHLFCNRQISEELCMPAASITAASSVLFPRKILCVSGKGFFRRGIQNELLLSSPGREASGIGIEVAFSKLGRREKQREGLGS